MGSTEMKVRQMFGTRTDRPQKDLARTGMRSETGAEAEVVRIEKENTEKNGEENERGRKKRRRKAKATEVAVEENIQRVKVPERVIRRVEENVMIETEIVMTRIGTAPEAERNGEMSEMKKEREVVRNERTEAEESVKRGVEKNGKIRTGKKGKKEAVKNARNESGREAEWTGKRGNGKEVGRNGRIGTEENARI